MKEPIAMEIAISVFRDMRWCRGTKSFHFKPKTNTFMYTSMVEKLSFLCPNKYFLDNTFNVPGTFENEIGGTRDGKRFKESELYSIEPHSFMIKLYADEFEITNPI